MRIIRSFHVCFHIFLFALPHLQCRAGDGLVAGREQAFQVLDYEAGLAKTSQHGELHNGRFDRHFHGIEASFRLPEALYLFFKWNWWQSFRLRIGVFFAALLAFLATPRPQRPDQLLFGTPPQPEDEEWVFVETLAQDVVDRRYVFADYRRVRATAFGV